MYKRQQPPFEHGYDIVSAETAMKVVELFRFVMPANLMGLPAACVATSVANDLPTGVQVMGTLMRDDLCLDEMCIRDSYKARRAPRRRGPPPR